MTENYDFASMTGSQLVEWYNNHANKPVSRFASRGVGIRRCEEMLAALAFDRPEEPASAAPVPQPVEAPPTQERKMNEMTDTATAARGPVSQETRDKQAAAMRASWADPETRAKRTQRMGVFVPQTDETYTSMAKAFEALGLDMRYHVKVRGQMRESGTVEYEGYTFQRVNRVGSLFEPIRSAT